MKLCFGYSLSKLFIWRAFALLFCLLVLVLRWLGFNATLSPWIQQYKSMVTTKRSIFTFHNILSWFAPEIKIRYVSQNHTNIPLEFDLFFSAIKQTFGHLWCLQYCGFYLMCPIVTVTGLFKAQNMHPYHLNVLHCEQYPLNLDPGLTVSISCLLHLIHENCIATASKNIRCSMRIVQQHT